MLRLRPYKKCDAEHIVKWVKDEYSFRQWCADRYESYPISSQDINEHYEDIAYSDNFYQMTAIDDTGVVGHLIMRFTDEEKNILRLGFIIVDDKLRGKGYGKEMLQLTLKYAFEILRVNKVTLGVFENNKAAYHAYKAVGFEEVYLEEAEYFNIMQEKWKCLELEIDSKKYEVR